MLKVYLKKSISIIVATSLVFGLGNAVINAAPKTDGKPTGRTEQNVQTGVITYDSLTVERYDKEVTLTGTVVIDGPQLVLTIPGSKGTTVIKVGDKMWSYEATVDVTDLKGDQEFLISAYTIYKNGAVAGSVHSSAPTVTQTFHVPYVTSTVAEDTEWTAYDRLTNQFTLSYNEVENWSVGGPVVTGKTKTVSGYDSEVTVLDKTLTVPTAIKDFVFSGEPVWSFDSNTNTYSATFDIVITDSKGNTTTESLTETGLTPGQVTTVSHTVTDEFGTIIHSQELTVPEAPVVNVVPVELRNLQLALKPQGPNQFKVNATYTILYSDDSEKNVIDEELGGNIGNPTAPNQNSSKDYTIGGFVYTVTVIYDSAKNAYYAVAEKK